MNTWEEGRVWPCFLCPPDRACVGPPVSTLGSSYCLWAAIFDDMLWMRPPGALLCAQTSPQGRKHLRILRGTSRFSEPWELETLGHPLLLWVRVGVVELRLNKPKSCAQSHRAWPGILDVSPGSGLFGP